MDKRSRVPSVCKLSSGCQSCSKYAAARRVLLVFAHMFAQSYEAQTKDERAKRDAAAAAAAANGDSKSAPSDNRSVDEKADEKLGASAAAAEEDNAYTPELRMRMYREAE